jgi:hypothetical protein
MEIKKAKKKSPRLPVLVHFSLSIIALADSYHGMMEGRVDTRGRNEWLCIIRIS